MSDNNGEQSRQSIGASQLFGAFAPPAAGAEAEKPEMRYVGNLPERQSGSRLRVTWLLQKQGQQRRQTKGREGGTTKDRIHRFLPHRRRLGCSPRSLFIDVPKPMSHSVSQPLLLIDFFCLDSVAWPV